MSVEDFLSDTRAKIEIYGRSVIGVAGEPWFFYTVGNAEAGRPDLLLVAPMSPEGGRDFLNAISEQLPSAGPIPAEMFLGGKFPVRLHACTARAHAGYAHVISRLYGEDSPVYQVILCDTSGRFPGEEGCDPPYRDQPRLWRAA